MWYSQGSVTVTNGSGVVAGAGTDFVSNASVGEAFIGPDGRTYEIAQIVSATDLRLRTAYQAATGGGQAYAIQPTQSFARDLALGAANLLTTFAAVRDGVGQGLFPAGTAAAPAIRFSNDQDTGLRWLGQNVLALVSGGVDRATIDEQGRVNFLAGSRPLGPATLGASGDAGLVSYEHPVVRTYIGDGTGYSARWSRRSGGVSTDIMSIGDNGSVGIGTSAATAKLEIVDTGAANGLRVVVGGGAYAGNVVLLGVDGQSNGYQITKDAANNIQHIWSGTGGAERARIDAVGNFMVGSSTASTHRIRKDVAVNSGLTVLEVMGAGAFSATFHAVSGGQGSSANAALKVATDANTGRSISAGGTFNASGADYAEYETKAADCGTIAGGDVCGVDRAGLLTDRWADALVFRIKSTDPSIVGGDTWAAHLGPRPEAPGAEPTAPAAPGPAPVAPVEPGPEPIEEGQAYVAWLQARFTYAVQLGEYEAALAGWQAATIAYPAASAQFEADHAAWVAASAAYDRDLPIYEAALEAERQKVDRIAYCGKVPVNMTDPVEVGDYLIAVQDGERIKAVAVKEADMTLALYMKRLGRVLFIRDGRPWVDVQHG